MPWARFLLSDARGDVDAVAFLERHDRLLDVGALARPAPEALDLALPVEGVDRLDLDPEQALDRGLDLRLGGLLADPERDLIVLRALGRLLGDHRPQNHVVHLLPIHARRSSSWRTAARVRTRTSRRRIS